jgi:hypothetical protein
MNYQEALLSMGYRQPSTTAEIFCKPLGFCAIFYNPETGSLVILGYDSKTKESKNFLTCKLPKNNVSFQNELKKFESKLLAEIVTTFGLGEEDKPRDLSFTPIEEASVFADT